MKVYTFKYSPFTFGGSLYEPIATEIEEYERVALGKGFYGILFRNTTKHCWHMALDNCGALIGTDKSRPKLLKKVKNDVKTGNVDTMTQQMEEGRVECEKAPLVSLAEFSKAFKLE